MRRGLVWALAAAATLSAAALWFDQGPPPVISAMNRPLVSPMPDSLGAPRSSGAAPTVSELPIRIEPLVLEAARRDIFVPLEPPTPKMAAVSPVVSLRPPAPAPAAPPMTWRYLGAMVTPAGQ